jgi:kumamolisin
MADTHVILPGSFRAAAAGAVRVADVDPTRTMELILDLSSRSPLPEGHVAATWSPAELATVYRPDPATILKVKEVLARYNLLVTGEAACTPSLYVEGSAAAVEKTFRPGLAIYREFGQRAYIGRREGAYSVPAELAGLVLGVHGLDGRRVFKRVPRARAQMPVAVGAATAQIPGLSPSALANHYKFTAGNGAGQKIGIAEFGGAVFQEDLDAFGHQFGLGALHVTIKPVGQAPDPSDLDTSGEVNMDVQIIAGLCPAAEISVYFAKFTQSGFVRMLDTVVADRPVALSVSYGVSEDNHRAWSATALAAINRRLNAARLAGITVCVSSGDDGTGCDMFDGGVHVEFPSSSPYVLAVGGTELSGASEVTWWDKPGTRFEPNSDGQTGGGSTGGGVSDRFARPAWQTVQVASLNPTSARGRVVPDVAALAGNPGSTCLMRFKDQNGNIVRAWEPGEGTSAAAPIWAALVARTNAKLPAAKQQRSLAPLLYQTLPAGGPLGGTACTAITSGNNASQPDPGIGYQATGEFSAVTGWGIPDGGKLLAALTTLP